MLPPPKKFMTDDVDTCIYNNFDQNHAFKTVSQMENVR